MNSSKNPLQELIVGQAKRQEEIDKLLAAILKPLVEIEESGETYFKHTTTKLSIEKQVLALLCSQLAKKRMNMADEEGLSQSEVLQFFKTTPEGTIKAKLNTLRGKRFVILKEKKNIVAERYLDKVKDFLEAKTDE